MRITADIIDEEWESSYSEKTKLFVGHLPDGCTDDDLHNLFSKHGEVTECRVINKYGFVHMATAGQAEEAVKNLNNYNLMGSSISVENSKSVLPKEWQRKLKEGLTRNSESCEKEPEQEKVKKFSNEQKKTKCDPQKTKIFVRHLPDGCADDDLRSLFSKHGEVIECFVVNKYGFVHMATAEQAEEAVKNLNNYNLMGSSISVENCKSLLPKEWQRKIEEDLSSKFKICEKEAEQEKVKKFSNEQKRTKRDPQCYSEWYPRSEFSLTNKQDDRYKDMCSKFRNLNISGEEFVEEFGEEIPSNLSQTTELYLDFNDKMLTVWDHFQSYFHKMEEIKKPQLSASKAKSEEETPPTWLLKYLHKMKQEIKEEILEEVANLPRNEVQEHATSTMKIDATQFQTHIYHPGIFCDNCDQLIHGIRYKCSNCVDFDLCEECESLPNIHNRNHRFLKIRFPVLPKPTKPKCPAYVVSAHESLTNTKSHTSKKLYEAKFVCDETVPDGTDLPPSTRFIKSWRVLNTGKRVWTHSTKLQHIQGSVGLTPFSEQVDVPHLRPGEEGIVSVLFTTPAVPGVYRSHWNFCHKSRPFGHIVWCHIIVKDTEPEEKQVENISETLNLSANGLPSEKEKEVASIAEVLTAVKEEHEKGNIIPRKLAVDSHTATPNNTPFDLTPPKSPDHQAMNELKVVVEDKESVPAALPVLEYDPVEEESVVSLSSSDSDAEFVVIPMPNCFNLSESLVSHNISHLSQYLQSESVTDPKDLKPSGQKCLKAQRVFKLAVNAETVSQETGVPELSERSAIQNEVAQNVHISHNISADGSSSEISIIESGDNSPTGEDVMPDISAIHIAVTDDTVSNNVEDSDDAEEEKLVGNSNVDGPDYKNTVQQEIPEKDDQTTDIPGSSATFPKFPVEGITSIYEPASYNTEERTVQVLPEKIVTVPLNVASTVYNATMQVMTNLRRYTDPQNNQEGATGATSSGFNPMDQLIEMGFCNRQQNEELLKKHKNDIALVVGELVNMNDNDWYASRHVPPSAPTFN